MKNQRNGDSTSGTQPSPAIEGELEDWFETGLEGVVWALIDDANKGYDSLHVIEEGDHLTVLDKTGTMLWQGTIECDRKTGATPRPTNPNFIQQQALGCWIHWIQKGFEPDRWAEFFIRRPDDRLRGILVKKSTRAARNVRRGEITDLNAKAESLKCSAGETLREDYMAPLGLSARQIAEAIPPDATHPGRNWAAEIESFAIGDEEAFVNLDLSLALDRYFGLPDGYFWRLQAVCSVRDHIPRLKPWLDRVKPRQCVDAKAGSGKPTGGASVEPSMSLDDIVGFSQTPEAMAHTIAYIQRHGGPLYTTDPKYPDLIVEVSPDGTRRLGCLVNRKFIECGTPAAEGQTSPNIP